MTTSKHTPEDWRAFNEAERLERIRDAAPELLEAVTDLVALIGDAWPSLVNTGPMSSARAAIAKATAIEAKEKS